MTGLVVHKSGMTRVFTEDGLSHGVTVLYIPTQRVAQLKTPEKEGYAALQVAVGVAKRSKINKPMAGHYQKAGVEPGLALHEFRVNSPEMLSSYQLGDEIKLDWLKKGDYLDISGFTKGCGYAGTVKRHNFRTQDASHGNSVSHRVPGSIGQNQTPGRVF